MFRIPRKQALGVELNGQQVRQKLPGTGRQFHALANSIITNGSYRQMFSNFSNRLMM
jgi:hypothetical protein